MTYKSFTLSTDFEIKSSSKDELVIEGLLSTPQRDRDGDTIKAEVWSNPNTLKNYRKNPIVLRQHNPDNPVGKATELSVSHKGLHIVAVISKAAVETYQLVKDGVLSTFSAGFKMEDGLYDEKSDTFDITKLELFEASIVSIPSNTGSTFSIRKSLSTDGLDELKNQFTKEEYNMDKENKEIKSLKDDIAALTALIVEKEEKAVTQKAAVAGATGAEKLIHDLEKKFADEKDTMADTIKGMKADIEEKASDLKAMRDSKMTFEQGGSESINQKQIDDAVLVAKMLGKRPSQTKFGKDLMSKAPFVLSNPGEHLANMDENWENSFSTNIYNDIRGRLIMEPLFKTINMTTASLTLPLNSSDLEAEWISRAAFENQAAREGGVDNGSTGAAKKTLLDDIVLVAGKLASKEYLGYEETEDTFLPIVEVVRDAVIRRMSKSSDKAILVGDKGTASAGGGNYPFDGIINLTTKATTASAKLTVSNLAASRRLLGIRGLNPSDVIYAVSETGYYDLLDDPDFRTMDKVGDKATILTGQIGMANGSSVVVSSAFPAAATGKPVGVALDASNFLVGALRGLMVERDKDIVAQSHVLVATRRFTFTQLFADEGAVVINAA